MAIESLSATRSRRALLGATLGAAAATAFQALARPFAARAAGDDGSPITVGGTLLDVRTGTHLSDSANDAAVISAVSSSAAGHGGGIGVFGSSSSGVGVQAHSDSNTAVLGESNTSRGVWGKSGSGVGVIGSSATNVGVLASSPDRALVVDGRVQFTRAGRATVPAGKSFVDVTVQLGLSGTPNVLATLQLFRTGVWVAAVRPAFPSSGKARIYLNKVASTTAGTPVAWWVFD